MKKFKNFKLVLPFLILISLYSPKVYAAEECFENVSRAVFKFTMALDDIILEPLLKDIISSSPLRTGTSNLPNIGTLLSIPNNILQGN